MTTVIIPDWMAYLFGVWVLLDCVSIAQRMVIAYYKRKLEEADDT